MFNLNPHKIKKDFSQNTILQMEFTTIEFELNMQTLFYTHFHLYWSITVRLSTDIRNDEFLFLRYSVVITIYNHVNVVTKTDNNSIVRFKLFFHTIKLEIIGHIICQSTWGL